MDVFALLVVDIIMLSWGHVFCCCESGEALIIHVYSQWVNARYRHIYAHIKF